MSKISDPIKINNKTAKNRILMPALVCFNWADENGFETVSRSEHYGKRAAGGTGTIVVEATAISPTGKLAEKELGLWSDDHIPQFEKIAKACHKEGSLVIVQLVHAGMQAFGDKVFSASVNDVKNKTCEEMTSEQINKVIEDYVSASIRAKKAGLDGIEIHGAHGYLLSQFTSKVTNRRNDEYGRDLDGRIKLSLEIVKAVREATGNDFIIGYRFGVNDPTFEEDIYFAKKLESAGVDLLDVSAGIGYDGIEVPETYNFSKITYMGKVIHDNVNIPVASVYGIRYPEQAAELLEDNNTDIVAVGRGLLADPEWTNKALNNEKVNGCYHCKPWCKYGKDGNTCPWVLKKTK
ncbi:MAG: NADH:flavin oxidoreductase [Candidatus Delongbacteria bacterium]|jgi:NADPH2 dehydrogenase|nr:NADH:flavin oxidoreductase [Candidatus Delongbacteria bacterium]